MYCGIINISSRVTEDKMTIIHVQTEGKNVLNYQFQFFFNVLKYFKIKWHFDLNPEFKKQYGVHKEILLASQVLHSINEVLSILCVKECFENFQMRSFSNKFNTQSQTKNNQFNHQGLTQMPEEVKMDILYMTTPFAKKKIN